MPWLLLLALSAVAYFASRRPAAAPSPLAPRPSPAPEPSTQGASQGLSASASSSDDNYAGKKDGYWVLSAKGADRFRQVAYPRPANRAASPVFGGLVDAWDVLPMSSQDASGSMPTVASMLTSAFSSSKAVIMQKDLVDNTLAGHPDGTLYVVGEANLAGVLGALLDGGATWVRIFP